jgi:hypothetical protein
MDHGEVLKSKNHIDIAKKKRTIKADKIKLCFFHLSFFAAVVGFLAFGKIIAALSFLLLWLAVILSV